VKEFLQQFGQRRADWLGKPRSSGYLLNPDAPIAPAASHHGHTQSAAKEAIATPSAVQPDSSPGVEFAIPPQSQPHIRPVAAGQETEAVDPIGRGSDPAIAPLARGLIQPVLPAQAKSGGKAPHPPAPIKVVPEKLFARKPEDPASALAPVTLSPPAVKPDTVSSAQRSRTPDPATYSLSGVSSRASQQTESDLMTGLRDAIMVDDFARELSQSEQMRATPRSPAPPSDPVAQRSTPILIPTRPGTEGGGRGTDTIPVLQPSPPSSLPVESPYSSPVEGETPTSNASRVVELTADRQDYDEKRQIFTAEGKVSMRFQDGLLDADRVQVNLKNRIAVAEGNVALTRGNQVLRGRRFEFNFVQGVGNVQNARGEIFIPTAGSDFGARPETQTGAVPIRPISDRIRSSQPIQGITSPGGFTTSLGFGRDVFRLPGALPTGGIVRRLRFEAERLDFTPEGWDAVNLQITNDPFSPPELVLKAERATLTRLSPLTDEVVATRPRLVLDQRVSIPLFVSRILLDRREQQPALFNFGYDQEDRGGLFIQRAFRIFTSKNARFTITPQYFIQRSLIGDADGEDIGIFDPSNFGVKGKLEVTPNPRTRLVGDAALTTFDTAKMLNKLRASVRLRQLIGTHTLAAEYSYRDRLFNGSLGFQTVQSSLGAVFLSPVINLGNGYILTYQAGVQNILADTDRLDLLPTVRDNSRINLTRVQGSAFLGKTFLLWQGKGLPATPTEGLRYTRTPIVPYVNLGTSLQGVVSGYSNGDSQQNLFATVSLYGQFGHFSRPYFDYSAFSVSYTQAIGGGESPFLFDRAVDNRVLSGSFIQQIYGPILFGVQASINLDSRDAISTDYLLEYSRRTHDIVLRYNPVLSIGSVTLRISDFNWTGGTTPFDGSDIIPVQGGVRPIPD